MTKPLGWMGRIQLVLRGKRRPIYATPAKRSLFPSVPPYVANAGGCSNPASEMTIYAGGVLKKGEPSEKRGPQEFMINP